MVPAFGALRAAGSAGEHRGKKAQTMTANWTAHVTASSVATLTRASPGTSVL